MSAMLSSVIRSKPAMARGKRYSASSASSFAVKSCFGEAGGPGSPCLSSACPAPYSSCTYPSLLHAPLTGSWAMKVGHWAPTGHEGFALLLCTSSCSSPGPGPSGFTLGSLSPRTLWLNATLGVFLALYFANHFRHFGIESLANFSSFLFVIPAIWGVRQGMRTVRLRLAPAFLLAATITVLMIAAWNSSALWIFNWLLICPAWFLWQWRAGPVVRGSPAVRATPAVIEMLRRTNRTTARA